MLIDANVYNFVELSEQILSTPLIFFSINHCLLCGGNGFNRFKIKMIYTFVYCVAVAARRS